jgi:hypothetical protein
MEVSMEKPFCKPKKQLKYVYGSENNIALEK